MELIDKAAIVAEIKKLQKRYSECRTRNAYEEGLKEGRLIGYKDVLHKLDTLEAKDADLEEEKLPISNSLTEEGLLTFEDGSQAIITRIN